MPFYFDFNLANGELHTVEVSPIGWKGPITIEYITAQAHQYDTMVSVIWRIKGTEHCFTIFEQRLNHISHGDYKAHFKEALENFRIDYLSWFKDEMYRNCEWKYEYEKQYGKLIIPDKDNGGKS